MVSLGAPEEILGATITVADGDEVNVIGIALEGKEQRNYSTLSVNLPANLSTAARYSAILMPSSMHQEEWATRNSPPLLDARLSIVPTYKATKHEAKGQSSQRHTKKIFDFQIPLER